MVSPLSESELVELEATLLPALERHHLRLLAHTLRSLQMITGLREGDPPPLDAIETWVQQQPAIAEDPGFAAAFANQLHAAGEQLMGIADGCGCSALALELHDLTIWAQAQADARLR